jgi:hypothetical protein
MKKTENMPMWVYLAFSSINTRKGAVLLILSSLLFTLYCIPWGLLLAGRVWIGQLFLIDDWSWFAAMVPITFWYWLSLRWIDNKAGWSDGEQQTGQSSARAPAPGGSDRER